MKKFLLILVPAFLFVPALVHAQPDFTWLEDLLGAVQGIFNVLVPFFIGLAVVALLYGIVKYVFSGGSDEAKSEGIKFILWGLFGIAIAVSIWGLVAVFQDMLGVENGEAPDPPELPALP
jgi:hypothetical protein